MMKFVKRLPVKDCQLSESPYRMKLLVNQLKYIIRARLRKMADLGKTEGKQASFD